MSSGRSAVARMVALSGSNQSSREGSSVSATNTVGVRPSTRGSNPGARDAQPRERARRGSAGGRDERERGRAQDRDDDRDHRAMPRHRAPGRSQQRLGLGRHVGVTETVVHIRRGCSYASRLPAEGPSYENTDDHPRNREGTPRRRYVDRYRCAESIDSEEFPLEYRPFIIESSDRTELFSIFSNARNHRRAFPCNTTFCAVRLPARRRRESERPRARSLGARSTSVVCFHSLKN